eukprot:935273-Lingulodinium_polyedra.AAC.1
MVAAETTVPTRNNNNGGVCGTCRDAATRTKMLNHHTTTPATPRPTANACINRTLNKQQPFSA